MKEQVEKPIEVKGEETLNDGFPLYYLSNDGTKHLRSGKISDDGSPRYLINPNSKACYHISHYSASVIYKAVYP